MRILTIAALLVCSVALAHADEDLGECVTHVRSELAKEPKPIKKVSGDVLFAIGDRALIRCRQRHHESVVHAQRVSGRWSVTPVEIFACAKYRADPTGLEVLHADACPWAWYHPNACEHFTTRIDLTARGTKTTLLASQRKAICDVCPNPSSTSCLPVARRSARQLFARGRVDDAARLMRQALAQVSSEAFNAPKAVVDPWAINDALFYLAQARQGCRAIANEWAKFAAVTPRTRAAFAYNQKRCR